MLHDWLPNWARFERVVDSCVNSLLLKFFSRVIDAMTLAILSIVRLEKRVKYTHTEERYIGLGNYTWLSQEDPGGTRPKSTIRLSHHIMILVLHSTLLHCSTR